MNPFVRTLPKRTWQALPGGGIAIFIPDSVFQTTVTVIIGASKEATLKFLRPYVDVAPESIMASDIDSGALGLTWQLRNPAGAAFSLIYIRSWSGTAKDMAVLAHEALHATVNEMRTHGIYLSESDNSEPYAHFLDNIVRTTLMCIKWSGLFPSNNP